MHRPKQVTLVTPCHHHEAVGLVEVAGDLRDEFRGPDAFFFNDTATTEIYTLSLHDALPISCPPRTTRCRAPAPRCRTGASARRTRVVRSEEHTSELQSHHDLVCRLLLE